MGDSEVEGRECCQVILYFERECDLVHVESQSNRECASGLVCEVRVIGKGSAGMSERGCEWEREFDE